MKFNLRTVGSTIALILGSLAATNAFPSLTPLFAGVGGLLAGWLNLEKPQSKDPK